MSLKKQKQMRVWIKVWEISINPDKEAWGLLGNAVVRDQPIYPAIPYNFFVKLSKHQELRVMIEGTVKLDEPSWVEAADCSLLKTKLKDVRDVRADHLVRKYYLRVEKDGVVEDLFPRGQWR